MPVARGDSSDLGLGEPLAERVEHDGASGDVADRRGDRRAVEVRPKRDALDARHVGDVDDVVGERSDVGVRLAPAAR